MNATEITPTIRQTPMDLVLEQLARLERTVEHLADETTEMHSDLRGMLGRIGSIEIRLSALELAGRWFPFVFSSFALALATFAIILVLRRGH